jgi:hypothetical protein
MSGDLRHSTEYMLTTFDNPFNPFTQFDEWYTWDMRAGYDTLGFLDRILITSPELSEADQNLAIDQAIDEIVKENVSGMHRKVSRESFSLPKNSENSGSSEEGGGGS